MQTAFKWKSQSWSYWFGNSFAGSDYQSIEDDEIHNMTLKERKVGRIKEKKHGRAMIVGPETGEGEPYPKSSICWQNGLG